MEKVWGQESHDLACIDRNVSNIIPNEEEKGFKGSSDGPPMEKVLGQESHDLACIDRNVSNIIPNEEEKGFKGSSDGPLSIYKRYSKTANRTLATFANEMSEILRNSIERLDCINLMVRGCMFEIDHQTSTYENNKFCGDTFRNKTNTETWPKVPVTGVEKVGGSLEKDNRISFTSKSHQSPKMHTVFTSADRNSNLDSFSRTSSALTFSSTSKKSNIDRLTLNLRKEQSIMESIRKQYNPKHKQLKKRSNGSLDRRIEHKLSEKVESSLRVLRGNCRKQPRAQSSRDLRPKASYTSDKHEKLLTEKVLRERSKNREVKNTKLQRKYANENFHDNERKERPFPIDTTNGKKLKILTDSKQDCCIIMHTHKTAPRTDIKPSSHSHFSKVLDDLTMKDLEPLKAEYPRRDHILELEESSEVSLLHLLLKDDTQSLQLLVDVNSLIGLGQMKRLKMHSLYRMRTPHYTIPEEPSTPKASGKVSKKLGKAGKPEGSEKLTIDRKKGTASIKAHPACKSLPKPEAKRHLKKFMIDPSKSYRQEVIVMPVLVEYDKDIRPHVPVDKAELDKYIYTGEVEQPNRDLQIIFEPNKPVINNSEASSILVQKMVNCQQKKSLSSNNPWSYNKLDKQQMISFIVDKEQKDSQFCCPPKLGLNQLSSPSTLTRRSPRMARAKSKMPLHCQDIRSAIDDLEKRLKEVIAAPDKNNAAFMKNFELEVKSILSNMKVDVDSPDFSVTSTSTASGSLHCIDRCKALLRSKTNLERKRKLEEKSSSSNFTVKSEKMRPRPPRPQKTRQLAQSGGQRSKPTSESSRASVRNEPTSRILRSMEVSKEAEKPIRVIKAPGGFAQKRKTEVAEKQKFQTEVAERHKRQKWQAEGSERKKKEVEVAERNKEAEERKKLEAYERQKKWVEEKRNAFEAEHKKKVLDEKKNALEVDEKNTSRQSEREVMLQAEEKKKLAEIAELKKKLVGSECKQDSELKETPRKHEANDAKKIYTLYGVHTGRKVARKDDLSEEIGRGEYSKKPEHVATKEIGQKVREAEGVPALQKELLGLVDVRKMPVGESLHTQSNTSTLKKSMKTIDVSNPPYSGPYQQSLSLPSEKVNADRKQLLQTQAARLEKSPPKNLIGTQKEAEESVTRRQLLETQAARPEKSPPKNLIGAQKEVEESATRRQLLETQTARLEKSPPKNVIGVQKEVNESTTRKLMSKWETLENPPSITHDWTGITTTCISKPVAGKTDQWESARSKELKKLTSADLERLKSELWKKLNKEEREKLKGDEREKLRREKLKNNERENLQNEEQRRRKYEHKVLKNPSREESSKLEQHQKTHETPTDPNGGKLFEVLMHPQKSWCEESAYAIIPESLNKSKNNCSFRNYKFAPANSELKPDQDQAHGEAKTCPSGWSNCGELSSPSGQSKYEDKRIPGTYKDTSILGGANKIVADTSESKRTEKSYGGKPKSENCGEISSPRSPKYENKRIPGKYEETSNLGGANKIVADTSESKHTEKSCGGKPKSENCGEICSPSSPKHENKRIPGKYEDASYLGGANKIVADTSESKRTEKSCGGKPKSENCGEIGSPSSPKYEDKGKYEDTSNLGGANKMVADTSESKCREKSCGDKPKSENCGEISSPRSPKYEDKRIPGKYEDMSNLGGPNKMVADTSESKRTEKSCGGKPKSENCGEISSPSSPKHENKRIPGKYEDTSNLGGANKIVADTSESKCTEKSCGGKPKSENCGEISSPSSPKYENKRIPGKYEDTSNLGGANKFVADTSESKFTEKSCEGKPKSENSRPIKPKFNANSCAMCSEEKIKRPKFDGTAPMEKMHSFKRDDAKNGCTTPRRDGSMPSTTSNAPKLTTIPELAKHKSTITEKASINVKEEVTPESKHSTQDASSMILGKSKASFRQAKIIPDFSNSLEKESMASKKSKASRSGTDEVVLQDSMASGKSDASKYEQGKITPEFSNSLENESMTAKKSNASRNGKEEVISVFQESASERSNAFTYAKGQIISECSNSLQDESMTSKESDVSRSGKEEVISNSQGSMASGSNALKYGKIIPELSNSLEAESKTSKKPKAPMGGKEEVISIYQSSMVPGKSNALKYPERKIFPEFPNSPQAESMTSTKSNTFRSSKKESMTSKKSNAFGSPKKEVIPVFQESEISNASKNGEGTTIPDYSISPHAESMTSTKSNTFRSRKNELIPVFKEPMASEKSNPPKYAEAKMIPEFPNAKQNAPITPKGGKEQTIPVFLDSKCSENPENSEESSSKQEEPRISAEEYTFKFNENTSLLGLMKSIRGTKIFQQNTFKDTVGGQTSDEDSKYETPNKSEIDDRKISDAFTSTEEFEDVIIATRSDVEVLGKKINKEAQQFCQEVDEVIKQIQEKNFKHEEIEGHYVEAVQSLPAGNNLKQPQGTSSREICTPFMHAVKEFRKDERHSTHKFVEFMTGKGHLKNVTLGRTMKHASCTCHIAAEQYVTHHVESIVYVNEKWTDSEMNVQKCEESDDYCPVVQVEAKPQKKCSKHLKRHSEKSVKVAKKKIQLIRDDVAGGPMCRSLEHLCFKHKKGDRVDMGVIVKISKSCGAQTGCTEFGVRCGGDVSPDYVSFRKFNLFLTYIYGLMFATVFCGLNLKHSCT